jgi:thiamine-phosphate pyrophosphorylase
VVRGLYVIVDVDVLAKRGLDPIAFATAALAARPCALQLRAKSATAEETLALLRALRPLCTTAGVPLVANDRPDLAIVAGVDMIHVGQGDASPSLVRAVAPKLGLGVSTHTPEQLNDALRAHPSYVAFGPVWPTSTKTVPDPVVGVAGLKQAARLLHLHEREVGAAPPLVAIGGIRLDRISDIARYAAAAAVISDLVPPGDLDGDDAYEYVRARARQLDDAFVDPVHLSDMPPPEVSTERSS